MVKDCWSHSSCSTSSQEVTNLKYGSTLPSGSFPISGNVMQSSTASSSSSSSSNQASSSNVNPWVEFGSRDNFIDMHIC
jgi:hypothetical protein